MAELRLLRADDSSVAPTPFRVGPAKALRWDVSPAPGTSRVWVATGGPQTLTLLEVTTRNAVCTLHLGDAGALPSFVASPTHLVTVEGESIVVRALPSLERVGALPGVAAAITEDGERLVVADAPAISSGMAAQSSLALWSLSPLRPIRPLCTVPGPVTRMKVSGRLLSAGDESLSVMDLARERRVDDLTIMASNFAPTTEVVVADTTGKALLRAGAWRLLLDLGRRDCTHSPDEKGALVAAPDGAWLVQHEPLSNCLRVLAFPSLQVLHSFDLRELQVERVWPLTSASGARALAVQAVGRGVSLWSPTGARLATLGRYESYTQHCPVPGTLTLLSYDTEGTLRHHDAVIHPESNARSHPVVRRLSVAEHAVPPVVASLDESGAISTWDVRTGERQHRLVGHPCVDLALDTRAGMVVGGSDEGVFAWRLTDGALVSRPTSIGSGEDLWTLLGHSGGLFVVTSDSDDEVRIQSWCAGAPELGKSVSFGRRACRTFAVDHAQRRLWLSDEARRLGWVDAEGESALAPRSSHGHHASSALACTCLDASGEYVASVDEDGLACIWRSGRGAVPPVLERTAFLPGVQRLVANGRAGELIAVSRAAPDPKEVSRPERSSVLTQCEWSVWDLTTGRRLRGYVVGPNCPCSAASSADGRWLAIGLETERTLRIFDTESGAEHTVLECEAELHELHFLGGDRLVALDLTGRVRFFSWAT